MFLLKFYAIKNMVFSKIVIGIDADECVRYAAEKLKEYTFKVSKQNLEIVSDTSNDIETGCFFVGKTQFISDAKYKECTANIIDDGYGILPYNGNVLIVAISSRGLMYGMFGYLEKYLGIRFLTAAAEHIPTGDLVLPEKTYYLNPTFAMRTYLVGDTFQKHADFDHIARTGVVDLFTDVDSKYGGQRKVYGRNCNHNFHLYCPFEIYGNEHPEFYRFFYVNEKITLTIDLTNGITDDGELDNSMEISVAKVVIDEMKKDLIAYPQAEVFCFTQEDGPYYYDSEKNKELEKKYKRSGILIRFCNVIVRELNKFLQEKKCDRKIKLMTFGYDYTKDAPVRVENGKFVPIDDTVKADDNLIIQLALSNNGYYGYFSEKQYPHVKKAFEEWPCIAKEFWFWGYDINFHRYLSYYDSIGHISQDIQGFKERGITYLCINGSYETSHIWQSNLRAYIFRKCMFDCTLTDKDLCEEYIDLYYKAGAECVKNAMTIFHNRFIECEKNGMPIVCASRKNCEGAEVNNIDTIDKVLKEIEKGMEKIKGQNYSEEETTELIRRLKEVEATPLSLLYDNYYFYYPQATKEEYMTARKRFFDCAKAAGIDYVAENWTLSQYENEAGASEKARDIATLSNSIE